MNAAQVRAKARMAMKRREEQVEQDEIESGEINLVPYLDIVTNLMLFLLVSVSAGFILGQINTTLPDHVPANAVQPTNPQTPPDEKPIQLIVSATKQGMILWSISGLEGTIENPKARIARRAGTTRADEAPHYDYAALNAALYEIAGRRWKGKPRGSDTYEIILQADPEIPYETIVAIMDALRRRIPPDARPGQKLPDVTLPLERKGEEVVATEPYDPDKHYLFPDVLFGKWSFD